MTLVGFRRATIGVFDETGTQVSEHVIEGKVNKGATSTASVTGLASEAVRVAGSDLTYYVAQQGTGDVAVDMGVIDLENEVNDIILGYRQTESKISMIGKNTKPPFCSLLLESSDLQGNTALLGFFKGKFSKNSVSLTTLNPSATFTPEAESLIFNAINDDKEGESEDEIVGKYVGSDETAITELKELVLPGVTPAG